jgi:hypothetical protein
MDSPQKNRQPGSAGASAPGDQPGAAKEPSVPSNVHQFPAPAIIVPVAETREHPLPVWMARAMMIVFVAFCIEVGLVLIAVPWLPHSGLWEDSTLLSSFPAIRTFLAHSFVRGVATGIGILDIWLGIYEAVHYRDPKPEAQAH